MAAEGDKELGKRIRQARLAASLSQAALAELADCTTETCARAERGESIPRTDTLQRMAVALGLSLTDLLSGEKAAPRRRTVRPEIQAIVQELGALDRSDLGAILRVVRLAAKGSRATGEAHTSAGPLLAAETGPSYERKKRAR